PGTLSGRETLQNGIELIRYCSPGKPLSTLKPWRISDVLWLRKVMHNGLRAVREAVLNPDDHIIALWGLPCGEWARNVARERGSKYSVVLVGSAVWTLGRIPVLRAFLARVIKGAAHVYADGFRLADDGERIGGIPVKFLPSTRNLEEARPPPPRCKPPY